MKYVSVLSGCFDGRELHAGHVKLLSIARKISDEAIVLVNSNSYVRRNKFREPFLDQEMRLHRLLMSGYVTSGRIFNADSPLKLIKKIKPDFIIAAQDYKHEDVKGWPECLEWGGRVILVDLVKDKNGQKLSTTEIIKQNENHN